MEPVLYFRLYATGVCLQLSYLPPPQHPQQAVGSTAFAESIDTRQNAATNLSALSAHFRRHLSTAWAAFASVQSGACKIAQAAA